MNNPNLPYGMPSLAAELAAARFDRVPETMPGILRIQSIERTLADDGVQVRSAATLFHERAALKVSWTSRQTDIRLRRGSLVRIRWGAATECADGAIRIDRLVLVDRPDASTNLFSTIPTAWVKDRTVVQRARILWDQLPRNLAHLFNSLMWDGERFHRYVYGPSSINGHHNGTNGNLIHSVEVAEAAMAIGRLYPGVNLDLLGFGGLVHDAAKAAEYRYDRERLVYSMSESGVLVGHRDTLIDWLAVARFVGRVAMSESTYRVMMHMLNAKRGAAHWMGLREPLTQEAEILAAADRLSAGGDLFVRCAPPEEKGGFGRYHPHLKGRPYALPVAKLNIFPPRDAANDSRFSPDDIADLGASGEPDF
jgi:3'-5' exoribonuclease